MSRTKARELPSAIQHLPAYKPPPKGRITHSEVWQRALARWRRGEQARVELPR